LIAHKENALKSRLLNFGNPFMPSTDFVISHAEQVLNYDQRKRQLRKFDAEQTRSEQKITPAKLIEHTSAAYQLYVHESRDNLDRANEKTQILLRNEKNAAKNRLSSLESMKDDLESSLSSLTTVQETLVDGRKRTPEDKRAKTDRINDLKSKANELLNRLRPLLDGTKSFSTATEEAWIKVESSVQTINARTDDRGYQERVQEQTAATRNSIQNEWPRGTSNQVFGGLQPHAHTLYPPNPPIGYNYSHTESGRRLEQLNGLPRGTSNQVFGGLQPHAHTLYPPNPPIGYNYSHTQSGRHREQLNGLPRGTSNQVFGGLQPHAHTLYPPNPPIGYNYSHTQSGQHLQNLNALPRTYAKHNSRAIR
jgi:iron-sulfur cluster repair protein YtfE (RIC family)